MDATFSAALSSTLMLCLFIISGYIMRKTKIVSETSAQTISSMLLNFFVPILMIFIITRYLTVENLMAGYPILLISFAVILISYAVALPVSKLITKDPAKRNVVIFALVYSNFGFMGIPVIEAVYGNQEFLLLTLYTIPYYVTVNVIGDYMIRPDKKLNLKILLSPVNFSIIIGFAIVLLRIPLGDFIPKWMEMVYNCVTPVSMILAGMVLGGRRFSEMFSSPAVYVVSALRLVAAPLLLMGALYFCGLRGPTLGIPVLIMGMPVAVNGVMLAESLKGDAFTAAQNAFISTFLSLITIPILAYLVVA